MSLLVFVKANFRIVVHVTVLKAPVQSNHDLLHELQLEPLNRPSIKAMDSGS